MKMNCYFHIHLAIDGLIVFGARMESPFSYRLQDFTFQIRINDRSQNFCIVKITIRANVASHYNNSIDFAFSGICGKVRLWCRNGPWRLDVFPDLVNGLLGFGLLGHAGSNSYQ